MQGGVVCKSLSFFPEMIDILSLSIDTLTT